MIQINYISLNVLVLGLFFRINDSGLFAWISLTALYRTYLLMKYIIQDRSIFYFQFVHIYINNIYI